MRFIKSPYIEQEWNDLVEKFSISNILQSWEWGQVKENYGWKMHPYIWIDESGKSVACALMLNRQLPIPGVGKGLNISYVPKGPLLESWENLNLRTLVLKDLRRAAKNAGSIFLKIDPDIAVSYGYPEQPEFIRNQFGKKVIEELRDNQWLFSNDQIQFRNTIKIDLRPDEETLLSNMKQKTRYNIRLAGRKGVEVLVDREVDLEVLYRMYAETSQRNGFVIRNKGYYITLWSKFIESGKALPIIAYVDDVIVAAVILFYEGKFSYYMFGMSSGVHREKMPTYLLQWEAIKVAKTLNCVEYDLWGAPDILDEKDSMWGVYRFKSGLGGKVVRHIGAWDYPLNPYLYRLYTVALPRLLELFRKKGTRDTRKYLSGDMDQQIGRGD